MSDFVMLVCAVLASLAAGVLVAYGVCVGMFGLFRMHARQTVKAPERVASGHFVPFSTLRVKTEAESLRD